MRTACVADCVWRVGLEQHGAFFAHQARDVLRARRIAAQQLVLAELPDLPQTRDRGYRKRRNRVLFGLPRDAGRSVEQLAQLGAVGHDEASQVLERELVGLGHRCQRIERREQLVRFVFVDVEYEHRHQLVGRSLRAKVAVDQHQTAVWQYACEKRVCVADFLEKAAQRRGLARWMPSPILRIGHQLACGNPAQF